MATTKKPQIKPLKYLKVNQLTFCGGVVEIHGPIFQKNAMENEVATVVQTEKVQINDRPSGVFRWQKYVDGNGQMWIVTCLFGHFPSGRYGANVELLNVDSEGTVDVTRAELDEWIQKGTLKRVDTPIIL